MSGKRKPWDRQDGETAAAFRSFVAYRDLGLERTLSIAADMVGKSRGALCRLSSAWDWVERCAAWDRKVDQARTRAKLTAVERMHERHVRLALELQDVTQLELSRLIRKTAAQLGKATDDDDQPIANADQLSKVAVRAVSIERMARGEATERIESTVDLSRLTLEELRELKRLRAKITGGD